MSVEKIIEESMNKNPLGLKEAFIETLRERLALALETKIEEAAEEMNEVGLAINHNKSAAIKPRFNSNASSSKPTISGTAVKPKPKAKSTPSHGSLAVRHEEVELDEGIFGGGKKIEDHHYTLVNTDINKRIGHGTVWKSEAGAKVYHKSRGPDWQGDHVKVMTVGDAKKSGVPEHNFHNLAVSEEVELDEANAENKLKKNVHAAKLGNAADVTRSNFSDKELKPFTSRSGESHERLKNSVAKMLRAGRAELKHGKNAGFIQTLNDFGKDIK